MGKEITPVGAIPDVPSGLDAVAVSLLHSDRSPEQERAVAAALEGRTTVVCSSDGSPEYRDSERTVTTVVDAYLRRPAPPTWPGCARWRRKCWC
jgi:N-methylhydantoinase A/oxoprolinase/acetone carboxylase beta subunit